MKQEQLIQEICNKMEVFKRHGSSCGTRQYLSSAAILYEYEKRLTELFEADEDFDTSELEEMSRKVDQILKNLGINSSTEKR